MVYSRVMDHPKRRGAKRLTRCSATYKERAVLHRTPRALRAARPAEPSPFVSLRHAEDLQISNGSLCADAGVASPEPGALLHLAASGIRPRVGKGGTAIKRKK